LTAAKGYVEMVIGFTYMAAMCKCTGGISKIYHKGYMYHLTSFQRFLDTFGTVHFDDSSKFNTFINSYYSQLQGPNGRTRHKGRPDIAVGAVVGLLDFGW